MRATLPWYRFQTAAGSHPSSVTFIDNFPSEALPSTTQAPSVTIHSLPAPSSWAGQIDNLRIDPNFFIGGRPQFKLSAFLVDRFQRRGLNHCTATTNFPDKPVSHSGRINLRYHFRIHSDSMALFTEGQDVNLHRQHPQRHSGRTAPFL